jgi:hypothetical protein
VSGRKATGVARGRRAVVNLRDREAGVDLCDREAVNAGRDGAKNSAAQQMPAGLVRKFSESKKWITVKLLF